MRNGLFFSLLALLWLPSGPLRAQPGPGRASRFLAQVGDIAFDARTDRADFALCDSGRIYQYYQVQTALEGEHRAVLDYFRQRYQPPAAAAAAGETGWLVIRFVVNCRGETDRFRVSGLGIDYRPRPFAPALVAELLRLTRALRGWQQGRGPGNTYTYLNFILKDGQLVDVGP